MSGVKSLVKLAQNKLAELCQEDPVIIQYVPDELAIPILTKVPLSFQRDHYNTWATKFQFMENKYRVEVRREGIYTTALVFKRNESKFYDFRSIMVYLNNKLHGLHKYINDDNVSVFIYYDNGKALVKTTFYADGSFRSRSYYGYKQFPLGICEYIKYNPDRTIKTYWYKGNTKDTTFHKQIQGTYLIKNSVNIKIKKHRIFKQKRGWIACPLWFFVNIESHL